MVPDIFTFVFICERLGLDTSVLTAYVGKQDAEYWKWKYKTGKMIRRGEFKLLISELCNKPSKNNSLNKKLMLQYDLYLNGIIAENVENDLTQAVKNYSDAIKCTCKGLLDKTLIIGIYSQTELGLALLYLNSMVRLDYNNREYVVETLHNLVRYVDECKWSDECKAQIYAKLIVMWVQNDSNDNCTDIKYLHLKKAYDILKKTRKTCEIENILKYLGKIGNMIGEDTTIYDEYRRQFIAIYEEFDIAYENRIYNVYDDAIMITVVGNYIRKARKELGQSQEDVSDGICAVESYSRIENGRNVTRIKYNALAEKLGIEGRYYSEVIKTKSTDAIKCRIKIRDAINDENYTLAQKYLLELKNVIDEDGQDNRQYIEHKEALIKYNKGEYSNKQYYEALCHAYNENSDISSIDNSNHNFTLAEISIVESISKIENKMGRHIEAIKHLQSMISNIEHDNYAKEFYTVILTKARLLMGRYYTDMENMQEARLCFVKCIKDLLDMNDMTNLEFIFGEYGYSYHGEDNGLEEKYIRYSHMFASIMSTLRFKKKLEEYFLEKSWFLE
jgi:transcriptional regulator with XRE-family HTH domain